MGLSAIIRAPLAEIRIPEFAVEVIASGPEVRECFLEQNVTKITAFILSECRLAVSNKFYELRRCKWTLSPRCGTI